MPNLNSEAIDFRAASEYFKPIRKLTPRGLQNLKIMTVYQGRMVPTIGGVLLFGVARLNHFPDAWLQAAPIRGSRPASMLDSADSHLPGAAEDVIAFLRKHMAREAVIGPVKRTDLWTFPIVAIREAVMNAIVHADYSQHGAPIRVALFDDRLEVENPDLLLVGLTIEDIQKGISKLRNRVLGRVFQELGLAEHWGTGIQRMAAACLDRGLDAPKFEEIGTHFRVALSAIRRHAPAIDKKDQAILEALAASSEVGLSTSQVAKRIKLSPRAARTRLASLVERGLVAEIGSGPQDPRRRYHVISPT
jgi:ATP-dependent DNA helicase RecG